MFGHAVSRKHLCVWSEWAGSGSIVLLYDAAGQHLLWSITLPPTVLARAIDAIFSPDSQLVAIQFEMSDYCGTTSPIRWSVRATTDGTVRLTLETGRFSALAFSPDGAFLAALEHGDRVNIYWLAHGLLHQTMHLDKSDWLGIVVWCGPDTIVVEQQEELKIFDRESGRLLRARPCLTDRYRSCLFSQDGRLLLMQNRSTFRVLDLDADRVIYLRPEWTMRTLPMAIVSAGSRSFLVAVVAEVTVCEIDLRSGQRTELLRLDAETHADQCSPDGAVVTVQTRDSDTIRCIDLALRAKYLALMLLVPLLRQPTAAGCSWLFAP